MSQRDIIARLAAMQYERNELRIQARHLRVRGDILDVFPAENSETALRIALTDDEVDSLMLFDPLTGHASQRVPRFTVYPSSQLRHAPGDDPARGRSDQDRARREDRASSTRRASSWRPSASSSARRFDLEMLNELGFCKGIENYSRHLSGRKEGEPPPTLIDYLRRMRSWFIDESHVTIGQLGGMYKAIARARRISSTMVFACPRPWTTARSVRGIRQVMRQTVFSSRRPPADYERRTSGQVVEQVRAAERGWSTRVSRCGPPRRRWTTCFSENQSCGWRSGERGTGDHAHQAHGRGADRLPCRHGIKGALPALGSETVERVEIIRDLRLGEFDVLVGINLLREGLDLPEVSLVAILDAGQGRVPAFGALAYPDIGRGRAPFEREWPFSTRTRSPIR